MFSHMLVLHIGHIGNCIYRPSFSVRRFFTELYFHTAALPFSIQGKFLPWETKNKTLNFFIYICFWFERYVPVVVPLLLSACVGKDTYRDSGSVFLECHMHGLVELLLRYLQSKCPAVTKLDFTYEFQENVDLGELMFSLCYLPTAGRLTITMIKARNLKAMDITGASGGF